MNELPPLPKSEATPWHPFKYTDQQMHAYAAAAVAAERERCALVCDARATEHAKKYKNPHTPWYQSEQADLAWDEAAACADAIRAKAAT
jgi:hypothetical protein